MILIIIFKFSYDIPQDGKLDYNCDLIILLILQFSYIMYIEFSVNDEKTEITRSTFVENSLSNGANTRKEMGIITI